MLDFLKDEAFIKPAAAILTLVLVLVMLKRINKILLLVGLTAIGVLYVLNSQPSWFKDFWGMFQ